MLLEAKFMKKLLYMMIVIPFLLLLGCGQSEQSSEGTTSEKKVRWKMASAFPGSLAQIGTWTNLADLSRNRLI